MTINVSCRDMKISETFKQYSKFPESDSPRNSINSFQSDLTKPRKVVFEKFMTRRKNWILPIILSIIIIGTAISVSVYFILKNNQNDGNDHTNDGNAPNL